MSSPWDPERWHAATAQLDGLLGVPAAERSARVERDAALAADVLELLRDHDAARAGAFLEDDAHALVTATATADGAFAITRAPIPPPMAPGATFGGYRIVRVLGRGGMGVVYEAEESNSGRRVALKVLQQRLGDERERERFEREGRLAASIDHEHCVYVFGATDVRGTPAIAMELMQGTLADRLAASGPLAPGEAVDIVLQLIDGLQAAADAGILHRDVKPSNCFVDVDGVVKIGDFGISRSLRPTEETALSTRGQITGTPTYAPPEQLRGATLDVRADIYSLGATLYELVTGRRPFEADDLVSLLMAVANDTPAAPHVIRPAIPRELGQVVLRCLSKRPEDRFQDYPAFARALEPHRSIAPTPATLGRRLAAGLIDQYLLGLLFTPFSVFLLLRTWLEFDATAVAAHLAATCAGTLLYYGVSEGTWRQTPGKALLRLTLVDTFGTPARAAAGWGRAALFAAAMTVQQLALYSLWWPQLSDLVSLSLWPALLGGVLQALTLGTLFCTVRRHNGYAALHDLATGTRVVERRVVESDDGRRQQPVSMAPGAAAVEMRGPFTVLAGNDGGRPGWRAGVDDRLRRPVWIRDLPPGAPPVPPARAALSRPTRLRWLAGRRTARDAWDVFERANGMPLPRACGTQRSWAETRRWVIDVAQELAAQRPEDRAPLALDRVWVLDNGRAKLLDDPVADAPRPAGASTDLAFLRQVVNATRAAHPEPWPLGAQEFADALAAGAVPSTADAVRRLEAIGRRRAAVSRRLRRLSIAVLVVLPVAAALGSVGAAAILLAFNQRAPVASRVAAQVLHVLEAAERGERTLASAEREHLENVLASRYRAQLTDPQLYHPFSMLMLDEHHRSLADRLLKRPAAPPPDGPVPEVMQAILASQEKPLHWLGAVRGMVFIFHMVLAFTGVVALLLAPLTRGLIFRLLDLEIVTADGRRASRLRVLARMTAAWFPIMAPFASSILSGTFATGAAHTWAVLAGLGAAGIGAVVAMRRPSRGLQDLIAGTWIVPR